MTFIDTHCHLNFKAFEGGAAKIIRRAVDAGVSHFVIPGTDINSSKQAVIIANEQQEAYAVVGIHPHHIHNYSEVNFDNELALDMSTLETMLSEPKVLGIGEVGLDRHVYFASKHGDGIEITSEVFEMQKMLFIAQAKLASESGKCLVIHNREAKDELITLMRDNHSLFSLMRQKVVFHCCEAEPELLSIAKEHGFFIGVDGDVTYDQKKQDFIKSIPLDMLVLETDAPYILPEPLRSQKKYPNTPANIPIIASSVANLLGLPLGEIENQTTANARKLFGI